jgi:hypothetical protein
VPRSGPFFIYDANEMPQDLCDRFHEEFHDRGRRVYVEWFVKQPGGPFGESVKYYTVENFGDTIKFNDDVDEWLVAQGAVAGEKALIRTG